MLDDPVVLLQPPQVKDELSSRNALRSLLLAIRDPSVQECTNALPSNEVSAHCEDKNQTPNFNTTAVATQGVTVPNDISLPRVIPSISTPGSSSGTGRNGGSCKLEQRTDSTDTGIANEESNGATKYYNVMWCKMSKKKHKRWEEDGTLYKLLPSLLS